jgi:hypothetical protein
VVSMPGRPCQICADAANLRIAAEMIAAGSTDQAVAKKIGCISRMAVARHRQNHIERPAKAIVAAANKGKDVRDEREQLVAAAEAGDTAATFLALNQIAADLRRVQERLERTADAAEEDKQRLAVASLAGQQLRAAEVRAKLGGVGGYASPRADKPGGAPFVLNIIFSEREATRIEGTPIHPDDPAFNAVPSMPLSIGGTHDGASGVTDEQHGEAEFGEDV